MAKFLSIVISVFLLSACATVTEDNGSQVAIQELPTPDAEIRPGESNVQAPAEPARNEVARKIPTKQEIKSIQAQLKAADLIPGLWMERWEPKRRPPCAGCSRDART